MKYWLCEVCGYIHQGETPPDKCPVCGVGPERFRPVESPKIPTRWKCTVCDYIHVGAMPPDICPVCGVGKEFFVALSDEQQPPAAGGPAIDPATINSALDALSYGLYVVSSKKDGKINGQTVNTVFQLTSRPAQIAVCLNKRNLTHEYVVASGVFAVSILSQDQCDVARKFGSQSGRNADKFADIAYRLGDNGCPILLDCLGYIEASVATEKIVDVGTHTMFVAAVTGGGLVNVRQPLTYAHYRSTK